MADLSLSVELADAEATARLGADLAAVARPGDVFALSGDLGAGKTTLARGFIRALACDPSLEVPSPTFTLAQAYETGIPATHFDLYRLADGSELDELGFGEATETGVALVEWPERAGDRLPGDAIMVSLGQHGAGRLATIIGPSLALERIGRSLRIRTFLERSGLGAAERHYLLGDASTRAYETVLAEGRPPLILMNAPRQPDGPPIRDGKPYSQIAHLAESVTPFVAIARALRARGFAAPKIEHQDLEQGLLVIEHLGEEGMVADGAPVAERYIAAAELLAELHREPWPRKMEAAPGVVHSVPDYDVGAMSIETELLSNWYLPRVSGHGLSGEDRAAFAAAWATASARLRGAERSLVLRDYHSPNLIWRADRAGIDRLGLLDFQDAMMGPAAYDVASLAQDARVTVPPELEAEILEAYHAARLRQGGFDRAGFEQAYAIMAAQRNSKILGIFVRLDQRDGKPQYLKHLPRIRDYVARSLRHPGLAEVREFYLRHGIVEQ